MKLKEFLSLFRTMEGGISSFNNKEAKKIAKMRLQLNPDSAPSDNVESRRK